jgi:hypothetical protein
MAEFSLTVRDVDRRADRARRAALRTSGGELVQTNQKGLRLAQTNLVVKPNGEP